MTLKRSSRLLVAHGHSLKQTLLRKVSRRFILKRWYNKFAVHRLRWKEGPTPIFNKKAEGCKPSANDFCCDWKKSVFRGFFGTEAGVCADLKFGELIIRGSVLGQQSAKYRGYESDRYADQRRIFKREKCIFLHEVRAQ